MPAPEPVGLGKDRRDAPPGHGRAWARSFRYRDPTHPSCRCCRLFHMNADCAGLRSRNKSWLPYSGLATGGTSQWVGRCGRNERFALKIDLAAKVSAFCRELGDSVLREMAHQQGGEEELAFQRAEESLKAGQIGPGLEADLDSLDEMVRRVEGQGLYPAATRTFQQLPDPERATGAQWWTCPSGRCAGRGRVKPRQEAPVCAATSKPLVPGPLPR